MANRTDPPGYFWRLVESQQPVQESDVTHLSHHADMESAIGNLRLEEVGDAEIADGQPYRCQSPLPYVA